MFALDALAPKENIVSVCAQSNCVSVDRFNFPHIDSGPKRTGIHSWRSASIGSSREARHAG